MVKIQTETVVHNILLLFKFKNLDVNPNIRVVV